MGLALDEWPNTSPTVRMSREVWRVVAGETAPLDVAELFDAQQAESTLALELVGAPPSGLSLDLQNIDSVARCVARADSDLDQAIEVVFEVRDNDGLTAGGRFTILVTPPSSGATSWSAY